MSEPCHAGCRTSKPAEEAAAPLEREKLLRKLAEPNGLKTGLSPIAGESPENHPSGPCSRFSCQRTLLHPEAGSSTSLEACAAEAQKQGPKGLQGQQGQE